MSTPSQTGQPQTGQPQNPGYAPGQPVPPNAGQDQAPAGYAPGQPVLPNAGQGYGPPPQNANFGGQPGQPGQAAAGQYSQPGQAQPGFGQAQPGILAQYGHPGQQAQPAFAGPNPFPHAKATFGSALRSEWTKIRTVRSTFWTLLVTMVITIGLGALIALGSSSHPSPDDDLVANSMSGLFFGQLVIVVFGAMAITTEYSTGMIRTSLTSQPRRGSLLWAKALIVAAVALVIGLICSFTSFFIATAIYSGHDIHISLSDDKVLRAVIGGGLYMAVTALLAFGLGALLRHTAGAITAGVGLLFVLFVLVQFLPHDWHDKIAKWIPFFAGLQIITTRPQEDMLAPWTGFAVFAAYAAIALIGGAIVMHKKDA